MRIQNVTVVGSGTMGSQIGMVSALSGFNTHIVDVSSEALRTAEEVLRQRMARDIAKGRRTQEQVKSAFSLLTFTIDQQQAVKNADIVIEAAVEKEDVKKKLFAELDRMCPEHCILVTNSSNIVSSRLSGATTRADKVCNMHFFNPVLVMKACEIVPNRKTSEDTIRTVTKFAEAMGKHVIHVQKEIPGFVANRLLAAIRKEALALYEDGYASFEDIDSAAKFALGHPMGPFELMDLVGIDVAYLIRLAEYEQTGDPDSLPSKVLEEKYKSGHLGKKTGEGWYRYDADGNKVSD